MPNTDAEPGIPPGKGRFYVLMMIERDSDHMDPNLKAFLELVERRLERRCGSRGHRQS